MTKASDNVFPRFLVSEGGSTATPAAGNVTFYAKADGLLYSKDDAGAETLMSGGAGGGGAAVVPWSISPEGGAAVVQFRTVGAANRAIYAPCTIPADCTITGIRVPIGTQSSDIDVGLYDSAGNRVASSGSTACPAPGVNDIPFTGTYAATAGRFYLAIAFNSNTATFGANQNVSNGVSGPTTSRYQETAFPLPATASFSQPISTPAIVGLISGGHP